MATGHRSNATGVPENPHDVAFDGHIHHHICGSKTMHCEICDISKFPSTDENPESTRFLVFCTAKISTHGAGQIRNTDEFIMLLHTLKESATKCGCNWTDTRS